MPVERSKCFAWGLVLCAACGCAKVRVESAPVRVQVDPIHVTVDVNVRVDRELENFFSDVDGATPTATPAASTSKTQNKEPSK